MCKNGQCGKFDGTGSWRLTALASNRQPRIPGITLPKAFTIVSPDGETFSEGSYKDPTLGTFPEGIVFSKQGARKLLNQLRSREIIRARLGNKLAKLVNRHEDMPHDVSGVFGQASANFKRPMLDMNDFQIGLSISVSVYRKGKRLVFGKHPLAGISFSFMDALEMLARLRIELEITPDDEQRLREDLAKNMPDRYQIPLTTPESLKMIKNELIGAPDFVQKMAVHFLG